MEGRTGGTPEVYGKEDGGCVAFLAAGDVERTHRELTVPYQLFDCQTEELVASGHNKKLFSTKMNIDVVQDGLPILDVIVLSFVICELIRKREEDVTVNATTYMNA